MKYRIRRCFRAITLLTHMYKTVTALASWLIYECTDTTEQKMIHDKMLTNVGTTSFVHASVAVASSSIAALVSWVQQHHEQRMVPRGSNKRLTHKTIAYAKKLNTSLLRGSPVCTHICSSLSYLVIGMRRPLLTSTERNIHVHVYRLIGELFCGF